MIVGVAYYFEFRVSCFPSNDTIGGFRYVLRCKSGAVVIWLGRGLITWDSRGDSEVVGVAVAKEENEMIEGNMVGDSKADDVDGDKFRLLE